MANSPRAMRQKFSLVFEEASTMKLVDFSRDPRYRFQSTLMSGNFVLTILNGQNMMIINNLFSRRDIIEEWEGK